VDYRLLFYFFFQAEDGIRDFHVTGVQTCALPIYRLLVVLLQTTSITHLQTYYDVIVWSRCFTCSLLTNFVMKTVTPFSEFTLTSSIKVSIKNRPSPPSLN